VAAYFGLAWLISWAWVIPLAATAQTVYQGRGWPTHLPSLAGPLVAAFIVTGCTTGRAGARDLVARMSRWRIGWRWWLMACSPLGFLGVALLGMAAVGASIPPTRDFARFSGVPAGLGVVVVALLIIAINGFGEETGWRGYALPELQRRFSPLAATLILSAGWAIWHVPMFFLLDSYGKFSAPMLLVFAFGLACGAVVLTWLYNHTGGSVLAVVVWHGLYNVAGATAAASDGSGTIAAVVWTLVVAQALVLVIFEVRARRRGTPSVLAAP